MKYGATRLSRDLFDGGRALWVDSWKRQPSVFYGHLPGTSFLYIAQGIADTSGGGRALIDSADWRLFLLSPDDVEHEFHELHQFQKVRIEAAGSLISLKLPAASLEEYAEQVSKGEDLECLIGLIV